MLKHLPLTAFWIVVLIISFSLLSCSRDKKADWTILIYMAADNDLSEQAKEDIIQMERAKIPSSVNVIVQLDPNQYASDPQARRYKISHNTSPVIASPVIEFIGEIDSGDYLSLADFVNWGIRKYPASRHALIIWSHGSGWTREETEDSRWICIDTHSMSQMSVAQGEFRSAFQLFSRKMDILILDACFMQTIEVITEVYRFSEYVIGSQNSVPYEGFPYQEILEIWNTSRSPQQISMEIVEQYSISHLPGGSQNPGGFERYISCSAAHSSQIPGFLNALNNFISNLTNNSERDDIETARKLSYPFHYTQSEIDLKDFFSHLHEVTENEALKSDANEVLNSLNKLFVAHVTQNLPPNTGTATIWFPDRTDSFSGGKELYSNLQFAGMSDWLEFLEMFHNSEE